jgi:hypothetical protein
VEPDDDYAFAERLGAKYGGLHLRNMDRPGEHRTVVTVRLTRVRAVDMREPGTVGSSLKTPTGCFTALLLKESRPRPSPGCIHHGGGMETSRIRNASSS